MTENSTTVNALLEIVKSNADVMRQTQRINTAFRTLSLLAVLSFLGLSVYSNWSSLTNRNRPMSRWCVLAAKSPRTAKPMPIA